ncbi:MAG: DUF998 domain-containing protein, partial [Pseudomonadales bacterium]|nr:DUF998 domain-containing protein [Pseudomonadales bacterium]
MNLTLICLTVTSILLQINAQILFARKTPDYSFKSKTISELAERNAPQGPAVRVFFFLPQALLLWGLAYGLYTQNPLLETVSILVLLTGTGYFVATFFPCDKGSPIWGTISNRIHNLGGTFEYIGAVGGFLWFSYLELAPYSRLQHTLSMLLG